MRKYGNPEDFADRCYLRLKQLINYLFPYLKKYFLYFIIGIIFKNVIQDVSICTYLVNYLKINPNDIKVLLKCSPHVIVAAEMCMDWFKRAKKSN